MLILSGVFFEPQGKVKFLKPQINELLNIYGLRFQCILAFHAYSKANFPKKNLKGYFFSYHSPEKRFRNANEKEKFSRKFVQPSFKGLNYEL